MKGTRFTSCLIVCLLLAAASALHAQTNPPIQSIQQRFHEQPPGQAPAVGGATIGGPYGVLTEEQRVSYRAAMKAADGKLAELTAQLRASHQEVVAASLILPFNENLVHEKALASAQIEAEMVVIRARAYAEVQPPLSPDQIEKIKSSQTVPARLPGRPMLHNQAPAAVTNPDPNGLPPKQ